jgi:hypothetical protein
MMNNPYLIAALIIVSFMLGCIFMFFIMWLYNTQWRKLAYTLSVMVQDAGNKINIPDHLINKDIPQPEQPDNDIHLSDY